MRLDEVMDIKRAIQNYAKVVLVLCIAGSALLIYQGELLGKQVRYSASQKALAETNVKATESAYRALESDQQAHRAEYDPQQTVMMSYKVQEAKQAHDAAKASLDSITPAYESQRDAKDRLMLWFMPIIAVLLLHVILVIMFRPLRDELAERAARAKR
jgi:hypothetical protein